MNEHDQECIACQWWHEDGGEGPSMFCPDVEPMVVTRGPNWKPAEHARFDVDEAATKRENS